MCRRFLFQEFSSVLSRSMPNRPTSAEGGGVSAINNVFNGALRRFSTVIPNNHGLPVSQAKCLNSIQSPNAATKANHPTIGVVPFASRTFFSYTKPYHLPSLGETNYLDYAAADFKASEDAFRRGMRNIRFVIAVNAAIWCSNIYYMIVSAAMVISPKMKVGTSRNHEVG
ncbi:Os05g0585600 [Oryza sativa Japonica Group]|uniref:Os05g0585600 protein n=1 Tax=Oryza sativa subsp. japonica TaxID=39947 RepID=Q0DFK3_ORYSJ|nr:uncharacterized protein LOC4339752 isoform X1 [Oryza sativa Japonica Group]KAF2932333.1 hypothetical protein DAI22_05g279800 [Oryza sativa Japonica Group]BAF18370.2 Os05g0585600 [Oryza sativa Japonica Group]|eukprot:NP_001056456.2 Os05g0585600 [Oryza sativa Japonica Group]